MASIAQLRDAERTTRELLETSGLPQPDEVEYGYGCVRLFWHESRSVVIVDVDPPPEEVSKNRG